VSLYAQTAASRLVSHVVVGSADGTEISARRTSRSDWLDANGEIVVQAEPFDPKDLLTDTTTP
jgi:hypothetical protein